MILQHLTLSLADNHYAITIKAAMVKLLVNYALAPLENLTISMAFHAKCGFLFPSGFKCKLILEKCT